MNILQVNTSVKAVAQGAGSFSTRLANELVEELREAHPDAALIVRDLNRTPTPPLDHAALQALFTPAAQRTPEQAARVALDDALIAELMGADVIVLAAPMYNFGVPSQLKNWIDAISRRGVTFRYTANGPVGLVHGKTVYIVTTRGGMHRGRPTDQVVPYLQVTLGFLGIHDQRVIYAEGLDMGPDQVSVAMTDARRQITTSLQAPATV